MKKFLMATAAAALTAGAASAADDTVKIGILLGFTGPLESLAPAMAGGAEVAIAEVSDSGKLLGGMTVEPVRADATCIDAGAATAAGERLVTSDGVAAIMGAMCSGATGAVLSNVALPNGIVMISPSATSPALSSAEDNGLFFRTAPSDARQGTIMTEVIMERGIQSVALTYTNNDYGKGLADSFQQAFEAAGGEVTLSTPHEDGKADYSAEVGALAAAGGDALVVAGYVDQGGSGVVQAALDTGAFDTFVFPDGMVGDALIENFGDAIDGSFGQNPGSDSEGAKIYEDMAEAAGVEGGSVYSKEAYDAAALILMAMQAAGSTDANEFKSRIMDVANAPGEKILPGELGKALDILAEGGEVDYVGATDVELIGPGEAAGVFREIEIENGEIVTVRYR
ncbi:amino acid/amide ABC transporter substrate-binding protein, HAAT family [Roseovarius pacificus]|uniref:Amino acid/amide ABC transporter substrate-binding protein, HAAT family n=1 Tax=Roseovarius pacificus TaxID=337701 RepID=A0A1M6WMW3_9RHOB|nr:ABC transporter substrate-binding protein [Roseovarius pacificus]GGO53126.1 branched-chain amino acid ABC transporter substrate-binding protein [Roseovarius pacificus]SHK95077.1 amino acid/amide ABC transporter substrate-binding protein, HAAT family [Roseovarius pacificus]